MNYLTSCPQCGAQLRPHVGHAQSTPWLCLVCHHGWWCSELTAEARRLFRARHNDFGHRPAPGVAVEVDDARKRGHSIPDHMLTLPGVAEQVAEYTKRRP